MKKLYSNMMGQNLKSKRRSLQLVNDGIRVASNEALSKTFEQKRNSYSKTFMKSAEKFHMPAE